MKNFVDALARVHSEVDVFIRQVIMIPHQGHLIIYDAGDEPYLANVIADHVKWAHPVDYDVTRLATLSPKPVGLEENIGSCEPGPAPLSWQLIGGRWFVDVDKVGRYMVKRPTARSDYRAYLNGNDLRLMPDKDPSVLKRSVERRVREAQRINRVTEPFKDAGDMQ